MHLSSTTPATHTSDTSVTADASNLRLLIAHRRMGSFSLSTTGRILAHYSEHSWVCLCQSRHFHAITV
ncbi:MAG: hypothetical protein JWQ50_4712 [Caballeronia mineralivorans]|nr:hypothetical protein [Caballeronia mineralivorans]